MEIQEIGKIFKKVSTVYNWGELKYAINDTSEGKIITFYFENANKGPTTNGVYACKVYDDWDTIDGDVQLCLMEYDGDENALGISNSITVAGQVPSGKQAVYQFSIENPDGKVYNTEIPVLQAVEENAKKILDAFDSAQVDMKEIQTIQQNLEELRRKKKNPVAYAAFKAGQSASAGASGIKSSPAGLSLKDRLAQVGKLQFSINRSNTEFCILDILFSNIRDAISPFDLCKKLGLVETRKQITDGLAKVANAASAGGHKLPETPSGTILRYCFDAGDAKAVNKFVREELGATEIVASNQAKSPVPPPVAPASVSSNSGGAENPPRIHSAELIDAIAAVSVKEGLGPMSYVAQKSGNVVRAAFIFKTLEGKTGNEIQSMFGESLLSKLYTYFGTDSSLRIRGRAPGEFFRSAHRLTSFEPDRLTPAFQNITTKVNEKIKAMGGGVNGVSPASVSTNSASATAGGKRRSGSPKSDVGLESVNVPKLTELVQGIAEKCFNKYKQDAANFDLVLNCREPAYGLPSGGEIPMQLTFEFNRYVSREDREFLHEVDAEFHNAWMECWEALDPSVGDSKYTPFPNSIFPVLAFDARNYPAVHNAKAIVTRVFNQKLKALIAGNSNMLSAGSAGDRSGSRANAKIDATKLTNVVKGIAKKCFDADRHGASDYKLRLQYGYSPDMGDDTEIFVQLVLNPAKRLESFSKLREALHKTFSKEWEACWLPVGANFNYDSRTPSHLQVLYCFCKAKYHDALAEAGALVESVFRTELDALVRSAGGPDAGDAMTTVSARRRPIVGPVVKKVSFSTSAGADQKPGPVRAAKQTTAVKLGSELHRLFGATVYYKIIDGPKSSLELLICSNKVRGVTLKSRMNSLGKFDLIYALQSYFGDKFDTVKGAEKAAGSNEKYDYDGAFFRCFVLKNNRDELLRKLKKMNLQSAEERASGAQKS